MIYKRLNRKLKIEQCYRFMPFAGTMKMLFIFQMRKVSINCRQLLYINCNNCGIKFIYGKKIKLFKEYEIDQYFQELSRLQHKNILSFQLRNFDETVKD